MKITFTSLLSLTSTRQFVSGLQKLTSKRRITNRFSYGKRFYAFLRVLHKNVSKILATIEFSSGEIARKTLSYRKSFTGNINLGQTVIQLGQIWLRQRLS